MNVLPVIRVGERAVSALTVAALLLAIAGSVAYGQTITHPTGSPERHIVAEFWQQSGPVTKITVLSLSGMALLSWYVLATRIRSALAEGRHTTTAQTRFWTSPNLYEGVQNLELDSSFRRVAEDALQAAAHREGKLTDRIGLDEWIRSSLERSVAAAERRMRGSSELLATIVVTAPAVGLAGALFGICDALLERAAGTAGDQIVTAAAGEAFAVAALGLAVGLPAALGRRWVGRRNELALSALHEFAVDMRAVLLHNVAALDIAGDMAGAATSTESSLAVVREGIGNDLETVEIGDRLGGDRVRHGRADRLPVDGAGLLSEPPGPGSARTGG